MIWAIMKMIFFMTGFSEYGFNAGVLSNFLFIIIASFLALYHKYKSIRKSDSDTISDLIDASKLALTYIILSTVFMFVYYSFIDKHYLDNRAEARIETMREYVSDGDNFAQLKAQDEHIEVESIDEFMKIQEENIYRNYSKKVIIGFGFAIWIFVGLISSALVTIIFRFVWLK